MAKVDFKNARIHYTEQGKGSAVVLIHGFLENLSMWKHIGPALSKGHRVICVDLPGHGESECLGYVHHMEELAEVVLHVMRHLKVRKADIIGHSMGGYVALAFAEAFPDEVRSLTLYQSTALADTPERKADRDRAIALVKANASAFVRKSIKSLFRPSSLKKFKPDVEDAIRQALLTSAQGIIAALAGMRDRPNRSMLLTFPPYTVHLIASDKDPRIPLEEVQALSKLSTGIELHVIKGAGHLSYIEARDETLSALKSVVRH